MPTFQEYMDAARKAHAAGDAAAAARLVQLADSVATGAEKMRLRGKATDPAAQEAANQKAAAGIQQASDEALIARSPIGARAISFARGLPFAGQWIDEAAGLLGKNANAYVDAVGAAMERQHPYQDMALKLGGGVAGSVAALPLLPEFAMAAPGSVLGKAGAGALLGAATGGSEGAVSGAGMEGDRAGNAAKQALIGALTGGAVGGVTGGIAGALQNRAAVKAAPSRDDLTKAAQALYDVGNQTGASITGTGTTTMARDLTDIAKKGNAILPSGTFAKGYNKVENVIDTINEYAGRNMSPIESRQVREAIQAAADSSDDVERRIGTQMLRRFDATRNVAVPEYAQADKLWSRMRRGKEIDTAIDLAGTRKGTVSGALSNEFGGLRRGEIRGDMTYPKELSDAIQRVMNGGIGQKTAEAIGQLSPRRLLGASGAGSALGLSAYSGNPALGLGIAGTGAGAGLLSQALANRLAMGNARTAAAIARNGVPLAVQEQIPESVRAILSALIAQSATAPAVGQ